MIKFLVKYNDFGLILDFILLFDIIFIVMVFLLLIVLVCLELLEVVLFMIDLFVVNEVNKEFIIVNILVIEFYWVIDGKFYFDWYNFLLVFLEFV